MGPAGFWNINILKRTMQAAIAAAESFFQVVFLGQNNKSGFVVIEIIAFNQLLFHIEIPVRAAFHHGLEAEFQAVEKTGSEYGYFGLYPVLRNGF